MRTITVSVDEETYRFARIRAAELDTSVSALVREFLEDLVHGPDPELRSERLRRLQQETLEEIRASGGGLRMADNLPRDALYERNAHH